MARYNQEWDDIGRNIEDIIDRAVNSQDYQKLNQTIRQAVETAVDLGTDAVKRATRPPKRPIVEEAPDYGSRRTSYRGNQTYRARPVDFQEERQPTLIYRDYQRHVVKESQNLPVLYGKTGGKTAGGIIKIVSGALVGAASIVGAIGSLVLILTEGTALPLVMALGALGGGTGLMVNGIETLCRVGRFGAYRKALGAKTYCALEKLSGVVGKNERFVRRELQKMIKQGYFLQGHLDKEGQNLITSNETYRHFEQSRLALEERQKQEQQRKRLEEQTERQAEQEQRKEKQKEAETQPKQEQTAYPKEVQEVLDRGNAFIAEIRQCNDRIPGEEISEKISRMELIVQRIFLRAEEHPEIVPDLKKLMQYYLPMTVKLLKAYADMDAQPVQGQTIRASKREIEATLDTLNQAFEKLLDSVFQETALDVSSDISVLNTLLAQEGLVEDDIMKSRKSNPNR